MEVNDSEKCAAQWTIAHEYRRRHETRLTGSIRVFIVPSQPNTHWRPDPKRDQEDIIARAVEIYRNGGTVRFRWISIIQAGIGNGKQMVPWQELEQVGAYGAISR